MTAMLKITPKLKLANQRSLGSQWGWDSLQAWWLGKRRQPGSLVNRLTNPALDQQAQPTEKPTLVASTISLGLALSSIYLYPPLGLVSIASTTYAALPIFTNALQTLFAERKANQALVNSVVIVTTLTTQHFVIAAIVVGFHQLGHKRLVQKEARYLAQLQACLPPPDQAVWLRIGSEEVKVPVNQLKAGDEFSLETDEICLVAGVVREGMAQIEQVTLDDVETLVCRPGEAIPAGARILSGRLCVQVQSTAALPPVRMSNPPSSQSAFLPTPADPADTTLVDQLASPMLALGALAWPLLGASGAAALLNSSGGDNLQHLWPVQQLESGKRALAAGIWLKEPHALLLLNRVDAVVFDWPTLCAPVPSLEEIYTHQNISENEMLTYAFAAVQNQGYPLHKALAAEVQTRHLPLPPLNNQRQLRENGYLQAWVDHKLVRVGDARALGRAGVSLPTYFQEFAEFCQQRGNQALFVVVDTTCYGALEFRHCLRPEATVLLDWLRQRQLPVYAITDAQPDITASLLESWGIEQVFDRQSWSQRSAIITHLHQQKKAVCYIGNGVNQQRTMQQAAVSISMAGAATAWSDAAQIVLLENKLTQLPWLFTLAEQAEHRLKRNGLATLLPNAIGVGGILLGQWGLGASVAANALGFLIGESCYR